MTTSSPLSPGRRDRSGRGSLPPLRADQQRRCRYRVALQPRAAGERLLLDTDRLLVALVTRARARGGYPDDGPDALVDAEPTTFGLKSPAGVRDRSWPGAAATAVDEIGTGKISGACRDVQPSRPRDRGGGPGRPRPPPRPGQHPDRAARPPRGAADRDRHRRRLAGTFRDRDPQPPAHRDRGGPGTVPGRPEGARPRCRTSGTRESERIVGIARLLRGYVHTAPWTSPSGRTVTSATQRGTGRPPRRDDPARLHAGADGCPDRRVAGPLRAHARQHRPGSRAARFVSTSSSRSSTTVGCHARTPTPSSSATPCGPPTSGSPLQRPPGDRIRRGPAALRWPSSTPASTTPRSSATCPRSSRASTGPEVASRCGSPVRQVSDDPGACAPAATARSATCTGWATAGCW